MKATRTKDLRAMSAEDCQKELMGLLKEQFNLRMQRATGQLAQTANLRVVRRNIARLRTVMNEQKGKQ
ncbi:MAG: 50S ribosomal protein L29 [Acidithiobacillales bacterium SM23_46]|jgi:large subunit ribosomal protein L29|nr:MAG: 50S ribosomal protein L29 [Acidithiobacillales bacterium SM23_46]KPL27773.1 MAG: 50S ribosomal protein L29 [Acidithiobacillales bacterium SM1_46]